MSILSIFNKPHLELRVKAKRQSEVIIFQNHGQSDDDFMTAMNVEYNTIKGSPYYEWCYITDKKTNKIVRDFLR